MLLFVRHFTIKIFKTTQKNSKYFYEALSSHHADSTMNIFPPALVRHNGPIALCKLEVPNVGDVIHHDMRYLLQKASQEKVS